MHPEEIEEVRTEEETTPTGNRYGFDYYEELEDLYQMDYLPGETRPQKIKRVITAILEKEQPIHTEYLSRKMAPFLGYEKATAKVKDYIHDILKNQMRNQVEYKSEFCWLKTMQEIRVRIPHPESYQPPRPIQYIATEEIAKAMLCIASQSYGIYPTELKAVTTKEFGFTRMGDNIQVAMYKAYNYLLDNNKIKEVEGKVTVIQE
ncbi:MAG: hypothetical protein LUF04_03970 [Bacteroides sp.]|nr:hypothetical protein [Bacteroides sp.]